LTWSYYDQDNYSDIYNEVTKMTFRQRDSRDIPATIRDRIHQVLITRCEDLEWSASEDELPNGAKYQLVAFKVKNQESEEAIPQTMSFLTLDGLWAAMSIIQPDPEKWVSLGLED
jgi:hypothetical protein